jgi:nucleotide-binding universal stress UspA family protein
MYDQPFTVLVAYGAGEPGAFALGEALRFVRRIPSGSVHLIHVAGAGTSLPQMHDLAWRIRDDVSKRAAALDLDHTRFSTIHVRAGDPAHEIAKLAEELGAALVVTGARRARSLHGLWRESNIEKIMNAAPCPVVIAGPAPENLAPEIEPPCQECIAIREETGGRTYWCARHSEHHVHGHPYSYRRDMPFAQHDSEVLPTGVSF